MSTEPKATYLLIDFDDADNTTTLGKQVLLSKPIENVAKVELLWFKLHGVTLTDSIPDNRYMYLDIQAANQSTMDPEIIKIKNTVSDRLIPLPVEGNSTRCPTFQFEVPIDVSWRSAGDKNLYQLFLKVLDEDGRLATFERLVLFLRIGFYSWNSTSAHYL